MSNNIQKTSSNEPIIMLNGLSILYNLTDWISSALNILKRGSKNETAIRALNYIGAEVYFAIDSLEYLTKYDVWVEIEKLMSINEFDYQEIAGFVIVLRTRIKGNKFVEIHLNREL
jgi:hypothetical protein